MAPHVAHLFHYPVKGLAGAELTEARLCEGEGFPFDRAVAISNGSAPLPDGTSWVDPEILMGSARNPGLTRLTIDVDDKPGWPVTIRAPDGSSLLVHLEDRGGRTGELESATATVQGWVPGGQDHDTGLVISQVPLWEHADAAVSLVNLATVDQLARGWRTSLDLRRFRANIYLAGLDPWAELGLVGRRIRLGGVELEILRPMDACGATAVDPDDGSTTLDVPGLLAADVGHRSVGVYARVVRSGRLARGDGLVALPDARPGRERTVCGDAPSVDWPRPVEVLEIVPETPRVLSLWLRDPLGLAPRIRPGEHVRLHAVDRAGQFWRKYTVSGIDADLVRVTVALEEDGRMSAHLAAGRASPPSLTMTGPYGDLTVEPDDSVPVLLITAGIGITPTVALLHELVRGSATRAVSVLHVARSADVPLWDEVRSLVARLPAESKHLTLHLTGETPQRCRDLGAREGRPTADDVVRAVSEVPGDPVALICGPDRFRSDVRAALRAAGVPDRSIRQEAFFSPPPWDRPRTAPVSAGPFEVCFSAAGRRATWEPASGSLLDLAEACGLEPPVDCREAACNICATAVTTGTTAYTTPPMGPPSDGTVLICCAVPTSDVVVDL